MAKPIKLHAHQKKGYKDALVCSEKGRNPLIVSPGGSGKTFMIAALVKHFLRLNKSVLVLAHRWELIEQAREHLIRYGVNPQRIGVLGKGQDLLPDFMAVCVASVQTYRRRELEHADVVIVDEAHHAPAATYEEIISSHRRGMVFGFTATPVRTDGVGFLKLFDDLVVAAFPSRLIAKGLISKPVCWGPNGQLLPDLSGVPMAGSDFDVNALLAVMDTDVLNGNIVDHYKKRGRGERALGFGISRAHARGLSDRFVAAGIPSEYVDGDTPLEERRAILARLESGETLVLWTCDLANEGLDIPAVRTIIMARPTKSFVVYQQQASRGMRPGRRATLLDHAGNTHRFGLPYIDRNFSLSGELEELPEELETKECPECGNLVTKGEMVCEECGHEFPSPVRRSTMSESDEELVNLSAGAFARRVRAFAKRKGLDDRWVQQVLSRHKETMEKGVSLQ